MRNNCYVPPMTIVLDDRSKELYKYIQYMLRTEKALVTILGTRVFAGLVTNKIIITIKEAVMEYGLENNHRLSGFWRGVSDVCSY